MRANNAPLSLEELSIDEPGPGEVLIKTAASGICHSDLHVIEGGLPLPPPCVLGHEPAGVVEAVGPGVTEVAVVGKKHPEWGEEVAAFYAGDARPEELDAFCLDHIARFKRPKLYRRVKALPKNNYGKVLKTELRNLLENNR